MNESEFIEQEVQRRLARERRQHNEEIGNLTDLLKSGQAKLIQQHAIIQRITSDPLYFATLLKTYNTPNPDCFKVNDEVVVVDPESEFYNQAGRIVSSDPTVNEEGFVQVEISNTAQSVTSFAIGINNHPAQIRLAQKDDGTYAVISVDGKPWEVRGIPDLGLQVGESVKIKADTKQIVSRGYDMAAGPICRVLAITNAGVEVEEKGEKRLVQNPKGVSLEESDRVVVDSGFFTIVAKLDRDARQRYKLTSPITTKWEDIGGLETAKEQCKEAIEMPFLYPEYFKYYGMEKSRGILLYGPPGCGKTLFCKAAANAVATLHGTSASDTGYIYVKSPEILDKWVGNSEAEIRELFERGRRHYRQHGYPAILAFDEFDALAPQRGTRRSSDVADTIVPMFLGEMDGIDENQTKENPIVFIMTNRADILDPAIIRPGRISKHIKIERPNVDTSFDILKIHAAKVPFVKESDRLTTLALVAQDIFSKTKLLYRINNEHDFVFGDCINGAMLQSIVEAAKFNALHRDMEAKKMTGVTVEDFREATKKIYRDQRGLNHTFDIADFCEKNGLQASSAAVERSFGSA